MKTDRMKILSDAMIVFFWFCKIVALLSNCACVGFVVRIIHVRWRLYRFCLSPKLPPTFDNVLFTFILKTAPLKARRLFFYYRFCGLFS